VDKIIFALLLLVSMPGQTSAKASDSMAGCYEIPDGGKGQRLEIESIGNGKFSLHFLLPGSNKRDPAAGVSGFPMKQASEVELQQLTAMKRKEEKIEFIEGISLSIDLGKDTPFGIFKGKEDGKEFYVTVWPYLAGVSKRVSCQ
jgi:hypothetical protein